MAIKRPPTALLLVLVAGVLLRLAISLLYWPATPIWADSISYLTAAEFGLLDDVFHPAGYPTFLRFLHTISARLELVIVVQHLLGLASGLLLYASARRVGAPVWAAVTASAGVLISMDVVAIEHAVLSEALFTLLIIAALYAAIRAMDDPGRATGRLDPRQRWLLLSGVMLGLAVTVRPVAAALIPFAGIWVALAIAGDPLTRLRRATLALVPAAAIALGYASWQAAETGSFGFTQAQGRLLYAKVAPFADCADFTPPAGTEALCELTPASERPGLFFYAGDPASPAMRLFGPPPAGDDALADFAQAAIRGQPLDYAEAVAITVGRYPVPSIDEGPGTGRASEVLDLDRPDAVAEPLFAERVESYYGTEVSRSDDVELLTDLQQVLRLQPLLLLASVLLAVAGLFFADARRRAGIAAFLGVSLVLPVASSLIAPYDPRFILPVTGTLLASAALGGSVLVDRRNSLKD